MAAGQWVIIFVTVVVALSSVWFLNGGNRVKQMMVTGIVAFAMTIVIGSSLALNGRVQKGVAIPLESVKPTGVLEILSAVSVGTNKLAVIREIDKDNFLRDGRGALSAAPRFYDLTGVDKTDATNKFFLFERTPDGLCRLVPVAPNWN